MVIINIVRVGRKWNGRKLYCVTLDSSVGTLAMNNRTRRETKQAIEDTTRKLICEERPFRITGLTVM